MGVLPLPGDSQRGKKEENMMERIKRWISGVLALCMLLTLVPMTVFAGGEIVDSGTCGDDLTWTLDEDGVLTISGEGAMEDYVGDASRGVVAPWYENLSRIVEVVIESGVTSIGDSAFSYCENLGEVSIPESVIEIGSCAFSYCSSLKSVVIPNDEARLGHSIFLECDSLERVVLPDGMGYISDSLFNGCSSLGDVVIPEGVSGFGISAFKKCTSLKEIMIPEGVAGIEDYAFEGCASLTSIELPQSVSSIGDDVFYGCESLEGIWVDENNSEYSSDEKGVLFNEDKTELIRAPGGISGSYNIPVSVTYIIKNAFRNCNDLTNVNFSDNRVIIAAYAFYGCSSLTKIIFPEGIEGEIFERAFGGCISLQSISIPSGIDAINDYAFYGCSSLVSVNIEGPISIGTEAFSSCTSLSEVFISDGKMSIGPRAFLRCTNLSGIWVDEGNPDYCSDEYGVLYNEEKTTLEIAPPKGIGESYIIPDSVELISSFAFHWCENLTSIVIPERVTLIGKQVFSNCNGLVSIKFLGNAPSCGGSDDFAPGIFGEITATAYYPEGNETWTTDVMQSYGGNITWVPYDVDEQPGEDAPSDEPKVFCYSSNEMSKLFGQEGPMEVSYTFDYDDGWFLEDNGAYDHELAKMSIRAAMAAFNSDTEQAGGDNAYYIKALMDKLGYDYDDDSIQYPDPTRYTIGYAIGSKDISDDTSVIMVAVRGGGYAAEWHNNVVVGKNGDHQGFDEASIQVGDGIGAYIDAHKSELKPNIKVWLVGFSRAAAVANLAAADLCDGFIDEISSDDVFAYCFACPQGTVDPNAGSSKYSGIKNIVNPIDLVPKVAMSDWGFTRYGATYYLPFAEYTINYSQMKQRMEAQYEMLLKYNGMTDAEKRVDTVTALTTESEGQASSFTDVASYVAELLARNEYTTALQETIGSVVDDLMGDGMSDVEFLDTLIPLIITEAAALENVEIILERLLRVLTIHPDAPEDLGKLSNLMIAHYPELYLAWIDSLKGEYINYDGKYRKVFVNCPVDVTVYDQTGEAVAQIVDDEVIRSDGGVIASIDEDGQKVLILPMDAAYEIGLTATDDGSMSYMVAEYDMESQSSSYTVSYYDVQIASGDVLTGMVTEAVGDSAAQYALLDTDGEEIVPTKESSGDEVVMYSVDVMAEGHGSVGATPCKLEGEYVTLYAEANDGEDFLGWYDGEALVSQEESYRFRVEAEVSLVGRFTRLFHEGDTVAATKDPTCTEAGAVTYVCDICGDNFDQEIPAVGHSYTEEVTAPSCTEDGYTTFSCAACGDSYVDHYVAATGHTFVDGICGECGGTDPDYEQPEDPSVPETTPAPSEKPDHLHWMDEIFGWIFGTDDPGRIPIWKWFFCWWK